MDLGKRLKELRGDRNREKVAEAVGISGCMNATSEFLGMMSKRNLLIFTMCRFSSFFLKIDVT